jgi:hypothetical protein
LDSYRGLFGDDLEALAVSMDEAATQRVPNTNGSKMVPLAVSVDISRHTNNCGTPRFHGEIAMEPPRGFEGLHYPFTTSSG